MAADDRIRGALLAGLALAVLALGVWWWRDSAPALGPTGPSPSPSADAFLKPGVWLVDPHTGQMIGEAGPDEAVGVHEEPVGSRVTVASRTVWQEAVHLAAGRDPLVRQTNPSPGELHLLTVSCTGPGTLTAAWSGSEEDGTPLTTTCVATPLARWLTASGGPLLVRFTVADGEVDLEARLASEF